MASWKFIPDIIPVDGQIVWTRLYNGYANPFVATFNATLQTFTFIDNGVIYPIWMVAKWKAFTDFGIGYEKIGSTFKVN